MKLRFLVVIIILFNLSCAREKKQSQREAFAVGVIKARKQDISRYLYFTGILKARDEVEVYPRVTGKIYEKLVKKGDFVNKDTVLFTIDRDVVGYKFEKAKVESPISGKVSMIYVDIGDQVSPNTPVALIQDDSEMKVRIWVGEKEYPFIKVGEKAAVRVSSFDEEFEGVVREVSPYFDPATHTALVEIVIPNKEDKLKSGMFCEAKVEVASRKDVLVLPFDCILEDENGRYVYVVENNIARKRYIKTGLEAENLIEVLEGIKEGELIVHSGEQFLKEGTEVKVVME